MGGCPCASIGGTAGAAASGIRGCRGLACPPRGGSQIGCYGMVLWKVICCPVGHAWRESRSSFLSGVRIGGWRKYAFSFTFDECGGNFLADD